jgi:hypothetical protein
MKRKQINTESKKITIDTLLKTGKIVSEIASLLGISRQSVFYQKKNMNQPKKSRILKLKK